MPEVMRLNKLGTFSMAQLGQSKSIIGDFMKKRKESGGAGFQDSMLKLLNTLPSILKGTWIQIRDQSVQIQRKGFRKK